VSANARAAKLAIRIVSHGIIWEVLAPTWGLRGEKVSKPLDVTDSTFDQEVLQADKLVLVDFWAPWCGPCRTVGAVLTEMAEQRHDDLKVVKINIDEHQEHAFKLRVMTVPTLVLFKDGEPVERILGALPRRAIDDVVNQHLAAAVS